MVDGLIFLCDVTPISFYGDDKMSNLLGPCPIGTKCTYEIRDWA